MLVHRIWMQRVESRKELLIESGPACVCLEGKRV